MGDHDHPFAICLRLLIIFSFLCFQSRAETIGSVLFLDSPTHEYLRSPSADGVAEIDSLSALEVGAAVSVLLGFAPPETLSTTGSSKLNRILMPNPFDRPRNVLMLEVSLAKGAQAMVDKVGASFTKAIKSKAIEGSHNTQIELPGEVVISWLDGTDFDPYADIADKEISDFASWLGGSYVANEEPLTGALTISLPTNLKVHLQMSKKSDKEFITNLISLIHHIRSAIEMQQDVSGSAAALLTGCFHGIKALQMEYGWTDVSQGGIELFTATIYKIFDSLQSRYEGRIVGVILFSQSPSSESDKMVDVVVASRGSPRWLEEEVKSSFNTTDAEVALVRVTLAWIAGIILLIATLFGVYLLLNMPLTKDTLLYSNVKLD